MDSFVIKNIFSPFRFLNICKVEFFNNWRNFLLKDTIIILVYIFFSILSFFNNGFVNPDNFFYISLFIGIILSSGAFQAVHNSERSLGYFMVPASIEEKFIVKVLFTSVLYFIVSLISISLVYLLAKIIKYMFFHGLLTFLIPSFVYNIFPVFINFIIFHSIFFFGSIFFKKYNFLKTILAFVIFMISLLIISLILAYNVFHVYSYNVNIQINNLYDFFDNAKGYFIFVKIFVFYIVPVSLYVLSYLKLKKSEVK